MPSCTVWSFQSSVHVHARGRGERLGEVLEWLGREDEARSVYELGVRQAEKYGHSGMAGELRGALVSLGE